MHFRWHPKGLQYHELRPVWTGLHNEFAFSICCLISTQFEVKGDGARGIVEMLFCTSLIALVGAADQPQSSPRKLQIVNTKVRRFCLTIILDRTETYTSANL